MKTAKSPFILSGILFICISAGRAQDKPETSKPKIRFEARCEPESPRKTLIIVNDTCYFMLAHKSDSPFGMRIRMQDYGAANLFTMRGVTVESEEGKAILQNIPKKYNNQLEPKILVVNDAE